MSDGKLPTEEEMELAAEFKYFIKNGMFERVSRENMAAAVKVLDTYRRLFLQKAPVRPHTCSIPPEEIGRVHCSRISGEGGTHITCHCTN